MYVRPARRGRPGRGVAAAGRGRRRAVLCAGHLEGRSSAPWTSRRISATNTPRSNTCCWPSWPSAGRPPTSSNAAARTEKELIEAIRTFRKGATVDSQTSEQQFDALGKYAINLNEQARSGKLDPVIGRDEEIRRVLQILSRRTKNNPILVGEAGRRQNRHRRGHCPPDHRRRRAREPEIEGDLLAGHGCADRRCQVSG